MPPVVSEDDLRVIVEIIQRHAEGIPIAGIEAALADPPSRRTLNRRLAALVAQKRLIQRGAKATARYFAPTAATSMFGPEHLEARFTAPEGEIVLPISREAQKIREYVSRPEANRRPLSYDRELLEGYRPGVTEYLPKTLRDHLHRIGRPIVTDRPAGTFARDIFNRLLIDLSWASSRLEGNTYSRLDTQRLIEFGRAAEGKDATETQMILNHKAAIELLVNGGDEIAIDRYTLLSLHAVLSENLMADPDASGRLRNREVLISGSVYYPPADPMRIHRCFDILLEKAHAIEDSFEQAFFLMVHIPYLQPFEDVNKRVSRLAANIPFIHRNLSPLSFVDVPRPAYIEAILGVYELTRLEWLRDLFTWAYERSCQRYIAVRDSVAGPDVFRLRYREALIEVVSSIVREGLSPELEVIRKFAQPLVEERDLTRFVDMVVRDFSRLQETNIARYRLKRAEYQRWVSARRDRSHS